MQGRFGFDETTPDRLQLDAGEVWANFDIEDFLTAAQDAQVDVTDLSAYGTNGSAIRLGATDGGASFNSNRDRNEIDFDGKMGKTKGMVRLESIEPELSIELMEFTQQNLELAIAGAETSDIETLTGVVEITGGKIKTTDYIDNAVFIGKRSDGKPIIFEVRNCLAEEFEVETDHGNEGAIGLNFQAHFNAEECTFDEYGGREWVEPWRLVMYSDTA